MNYIKSNTLLANYKKFDYLNQNSSRATIKILVSYIKPSFLFKSEILTPIHLGRAVEKKLSKDGIVSDHDINWLHTNCLGDDGFAGNISHFNRRIGFLTGTYWAWKNYEQLGDPKYIGSFGYRRLLSSDFLNNLEKYDIVLPEPRHLNIETIKDQFIRYHGLDDYNKLVNVFCTVYPCEYESLQKYLCRTIGYFDELYVMKKSLFFNFCTWIFPLLAAYLKLKEEKHNNDLRDIAFIIERLTGYYCYRLTKENRFYETNVVSNEKMIVNREIISKSLVNMLRKNI